MGACRGAHGFTSSRCRNWCLGFLTITFVGRYYYLDSVTCQFLKSQKESRQHDALLLEYISVADRCPDSLPFDRNFWIEAIYVALGLELKMKTTEPN